MQNVEAGRQLVCAGIIERFIGSLIDGAILLALNIALRMFFRGDSAIIASIGLAVGYYVFFWSSSGQTPGKAVMNIRIIDAETGALPNISQSILRYIGTIISSICLGLGYLLGDFRHLPPDLARQDCRHGGD